MRAAPGFGDLSHGFIKLAPGIGGPGLLARGIQPPAILQPAPGIEAEEIGGAGRAPGARDLLAFVVQIGEREGPLGAIRCMLGKLSSG